MHLKTRRPPSTLKVLLNESETRPRSDLDDPAKRWSSSADGDDEAAAAINILPWDRGGGQRFRYYCISLILATFISDLSSKLNLNLKNVECFPFFGGVFASMSNLVPTAP